MSDTGDKKLTVPKFSSFKPKAPTPAQSTKQSPSEAKHHRETIKERRHHQEPGHHNDRSLKRHSEHRPENHRRDRKRSRSRTRSREKSAVHERDKVLGNQDAATNNGLFVIDKKGDPLISRYGGNDRGRVPLYYRGGRGRVLGSNGYLLIHRDGPREQFTIRQPGEDSSTSRNRALFQSNVHRIRTKRIRLRTVPCGNEAPEAEAEDFVPLDVSSKRRRIKESESSEDEKPSYRSIEGKAKPQEFSDSDFEYDSDAQGNGLDSGADEPLKQRSIMLSRRVKEHPDDIAGWFELIDHQDVLLKAGKSLDRVSTKSEIHSFAEIKISMYETALARAKMPEDEERLLSGLMHEGAKAWSSSKLDSRWGDVMKKHDASFCLWKARIDHKLMSITTFQYNDIKALHVARLRAIAKQAFVSTSPLPGYSMRSTETPRYEQMIHVFLRATRFMFDAGYRELAVAAWQALLELNVQRPPTCDRLQESQVLDLFREFWEDEAPRVGEEKALGWKHYVEANGTCDPLEPRRDDDTIPQSKDVYKSWGATERLRATTSRSPGRATDDVFEDDPYRVVMFSDIEDLLFIIPTSVIPSIWKQLIDAFLLFCSLSPAFRDSEWTEAVENDALVMNNLSLFESDVLQKHDDSNEVDESKKSPAFKQDGVRFAASPDVLFAPLGNWFSFLSGWAYASKDVDGPVNLTWVANTLRQLITLGGLRELAEHSLAVDAVNEPDNVRKRAKALIKKDPTNLGLYNAYAMSEFMRGDFNVGLQAITSATGLASPAKTETALILWKTWAWKEVEAGRNSLAVVRLCAAVDESLRNAGGLMAATPTQILKARQKLLAIVDDQLSARRLDDVVPGAECIALLAYLTASEGSEPTSEAQGSISAAMERIWTVSSEICAQGQSKSQAHERILQAGARLLYHHASRGPFRRAYLREQLAQCIELFPRNTIFLTLFSWASATFGIDDPVRDILRKVALANANECISNHIFAIRYELQRGNVYSTQAAFERALDSPVCRSSPELWKSYIRFSYARKQFRSKAKEVFFRGLRHCPWSKELALEAYTTLINVMDEFELRSVFHTMASKGLRIHVDLEEFVAKHQKDKGRS